MEYAPVIISVYNRYNHLRACVESLAACRGADKTDLFIALDAPYRDEDIPANLEIFEYAQKIDGFKSVTLFKRPHNIGARANCYGSIDSVLELYDRYIYSEDDNIFAVDCLEYMNTALEFYKKRKEIHAICGYNYPVIMPESYNEDVYVWQGFSAWGYGTWKERQYSINIEPPYDELKRFLNERRNRKALYRVANHYPSVLYEIIDTGKYTGDSIVCYHMVKDSKYCVFPAVSRVRNTGHDGSGLHSHQESSARYRNQQISDGSQAARFNIDVAPDNEVAKVLREYFYEPNIYPFKRLVKRVIRTMHRAKSGSV